jgi:hypothetical protein
MNQAISQLPYIEPVIIGNYQRSLKQLKCFIESSYNKSSKIEANALKMLITPENLGKAELLLPLQGY